MLPKQDGQNVSDVQMRRVLSRFLVLGIGRQCSETGAPNMRDSMWSCLKLLHDRAMPIKSTLHEACTSTKSLLEACVATSGKRVKSKFPHFDYIPTRHGSPRHHHRSPVLFFFAASDPYRAAVWWTGRPARRASGLPPKRAVSTQWLVAAVSRPSRRPLKKSRWTACWIGGRRGRDETPGQISVCLQPRHCQIRQL